MSSVAKACCVLFAILVSGCAQITISLPPYTPTNTQELNGAMSVNSFGYFPRTGIQQNEIRETAAGRILLTEPVGEYFSNAVRRELRQAGVSLRGKNCMLDGEVNDFTIDSLGFSADYITDVRYILRDDKQAVLVDNSYKAKFNTSKFVVAQVAFANINKIISDNITQFMNDEAVQKALKERCTG